ncbi:MAG: beta-ketoacyl-ACP synthase II [Planctomycetaceae bacterium]|nr:beta-ketoacyl-ACP synthase II [Planctomycetaceae bacterium]
MSQIVISGLGVVTSLGKTLDEFWDGLMHGRSGIRPLTRMRTDDLQVRIGGEISDLDLDLLQEHLGETIDVKRIDWSTRFALVAAREALLDAALPLAELGSRVAVILGSGLSGMETLQEQTERLIERGPRRVSVFTIPMLMPNASPANISLAFGAKGPAYTVSTACASSGNAMIDAYEMLKRGEVDVVISGGTEASLTRLGLAAFSNMKAMNKGSNDDPAKSVRPFNKERNGFIMSEGAGILIMETAEHLAKRGGTSYAELIGYGSTSDSFHLVQPDPDAVEASRAINEAFEMAQLAPADVASNVYVNAHGTGTKLNDAMETVALKKVFGDSASQLQISSTKSMTGHIIGASCGIEMVACSLALKNGKLPPTINYEEADPDCDLDYIPNQPRESQLDYALNNSFGFGGHNVSLLVKKT